MLGVLNKKRDREKNLKYEVVFDVITKECLIDGLHNSSLDGLILTKLLATSVRCVYTDKVGWKVN